MCHKSATEIKLRGWRGKLPMFWLYAQIWGSVYYFLIMSSLIQLVSRQPNICWFLILVLNIHMSAVYLACQNSNSGFQAWPIGAGSVEYADWIQTTAHLALLTCYVFIFLIKYRDSLACQFAYALAEEKQKCRWGEMNAVSPFRHLVSALPWWFCDAAVSSKQT